MKKTEKREKQMGDNQEFEVKAQTRKQGGNGTIQQMATESRSKQKKTKNKKCPKRQPSQVALKNGTPISEDPSIPEVR